MHSYREREKDMGERKEVERKSKDRERDRERGRKDFFHQLIPGTWNSIKVFCMGGKGTSLGHIQLLPLAHQQ